MDRAFIACAPDNCVAVLDLKNLDVPSHIDVGGEPNGLAWRYDRKRGYELLDSSF